MSAIGAAAAQAVTFPTITTITAEECTAQGGAVKTIPYGGTVCSLPDGSTVKIT
ncbi:hypothetical protein [Streptomyces sp. FIT100]|uniref:hypothetical protein n=1 Tax=Streptomyces sp. FIT100 TaxID=2837956 RepID=UPI0021C7D328|nr:hypothetical protein [Streptomyces sp. FIT100]